MTFLTAPWHANTVSLKPLKLYFDAPSLKYDYRGKTLQSVFHIQGPVVKLAVKYMQLAGKIFEIKKSSWWGKY